MKAKQDEKTARKQYSTEFKDQVLARANKDGVVTTARDLGLAESQVYAWRQNGSSCRNHRP
ncbi:MAG: transposase [Acidobacteriaceae bacterium]